jgi:frataxin-like iron-binding protein CyaY
MAGPLSVAAPAGCRVVPLPQIPETRGNLTALEELIHFPFRIGSVRWFYDLPAGTTLSERQSHLGNVLVIALSGSFAVVFGKQSPSSRVWLSRASIGLHVPASMHWRVEDPSTNSVGLVLSSQSTRQPRRESNQPDDHVPCAVNPHTTIDDCRTLTLGGHRHLQGSSTEAIPQINVPFEIPRVYYLYDIPGGASRGGHAHRGLEQLLVAAAGSFEVALNDGRQDKTVKLDQPHSGVYVAPGIWRELRNFSSRAICLTLASAPYAEADYIRDYEEFQREKQVG